MQLHQHGKDDHFQFYKVVRPYIMLIILIVMRGNKKKKRNKGRREKEGSLKLKEEVYIKVLIIKIFETKAYFFFKKKPTQIIITTTWRGGNLGTKVCCIFFVLSSDVYRRPDVSRKKSHFFFSCSPFLLSFLHSCLLRFILHGVRKKNCKYALATFLNFREIVAWYALRIILFSSHRQE